MWIVVVILVIAVYIYIKSASKHDSYRMPNNRYASTTTKSRTSSYQSNRNYGRYSGNQSVVSLIDKNEELIRLALSSGKKISFNYSDKEKNQTKRTVEPKRLFTYQFDQEGEMLCLEAFCLLRNANRTFALFRMSRVEVF